MAHSALHFSAGLVTGMAVLVPAVFEAFRSGASLSRAVRRWVAVSWVLGLFAIVPSLLHHIGVPPVVCNGWWMNVFFLHPLINSLSRGGDLVGGATLVACFTVQYAAVLAAIARISRREGNYTLS